MQTCVNGTGNSGFVVTLPSAMNYRKSVYLNMKAAFETRGACLEAMTLLKLVCL